jgi:signal transduction histidine kinase
MTADGTTFADVFQGGGELGALMRTHDWSATPLGPPEDWPRSLQSIVRMMLTSRYQMWMAWGPELTFFCNDAYSPTLGIKHPWALGKPARQVWAEIWPDIGPLIDHVLKTGDATFSEGMLLFLERSGFPEETYHTFSYSPLFDDGNAIAGLFCVVVEETTRVINERRLGALRELSSAMTAVRTEAELFGAIEGALSKTLADLPFTLIYMFDAEGAARLVARSGVPQGGPDSDKTAAAASVVWPVETLLATGAPVLVEDLADRFPSRPSGAWDRPPEAALLTPITEAGREGLAGFVAVGLNPYRSVDQDYRSFVSLLAGQISAALSAARAFESERRRAEALAEIDRAKTAFFSNVSHEFRTPLTLMLGPLEDALADPEVAGAAREQVELAHRNGLRLLRLVNSLLDFSRIEAGRAQASFAPTDLAVLTAEIAASFRSVMERAGLELHVRTSPLPAPVFVDQDMWEKILLNLLSNAFKFTFEGGVSVEVGPSADGTAARVTVRDTGIGVAPDQLPRLFERFHRVEGAQGRTFEGSGIGLALVQELVRLHGGDVAVESDVGVGTAFTISLPFGSAHLPQDQVRSSADRATGEHVQGLVQEALRWTAQSPDILPETRPVTETDRRETDWTHPAAARVLLADDNLDMRDYVRRLLETRGYAVEAVADGEAALAAAKANPPDLILSDVMMPRLDGFGLLRAVRSDPALAGVPVVLLSARAGEEAKVEGLDAGADDYLIKPFAARELLARVGVNIQMARLRTEAARAVMQSEQRVLITQERLAIALSTGRIAIFELDVETERCTLFGPFVQLFGLTEEEAYEGVSLTRVWESVDAPDRPHVQERLRRAIEQGAPYEAEYELVGGDVRRRVVARGALQTGPDGARRLVGAVIDISAEKEAQDALRLLNASLEERVAAEVAERFRVEDALRQAQKMEAVGQLTGGVAHDFNNLLTIIIGGLDTVRRNAPDDNARLMRALDMAAQGAQRAVTLTSRLLAFSRRQPLDPKPLELNAVVRDSTELLHRTLGETIELEAVLAPRLWLVEVDQNQLENAILNLAVNARDAMPSGGKLTIETANTLLDESYAAVDSEVVPGQYAMICVTDSGVGMPKEVAARAFEPFYTTKDVGKGTGLGLSMVYGFAKQSGGHVTIYSEPGHGTTVKLYFPRYRGALMSEASTQPSPQGMSHERILVVEDNADVRAYSMSILTELGYEVLEAHDAESGMAIVRQPGRIDLLFTDVVLPGKSGRMLADEALAVRPDLKVLFTTGYSRNAIVHQGRLDPGVNLITKPFTFEQLARRLRDVLDG